MIDITREAGEFKDIVTLRSGVEINFTDINGGLLFTKKLAGSRELEQIKSRGEIQIGTQDLSPEFDSLIKNTITELVKQISTAFVPE